MLLQMQVRRGDAAEWVAINPVLSDGEMGLEKDTGRHKFGDGITHWVDLAYAAFTQMTTLLADYTADITNSESPQNDQLVALMTSALASGIPGMVRVVTGTMTDIATARPTPWAGVVLWLCPTGSTTLPTHIVTGDIVLRTTTTPG